MEILSPAGNMNSLIAAVRSGADAIYFGVDKFNARRNAQNFTVEQIGDVVKYCHVRGVKAYLAINTLISDTEMPQALDVVRQACKYGIDAIIIADIGLVELIRKFAPALSLHASTQMTIHNVEGVKYLKEKGFSRVVLARENSLNDLKEISKYANENNIELEIFVTGAHCMSVSGQCYLSSVLGSRSGNRGLCAQPCRLPFQVSSGNGYDLSLKDMNLFEYIDEFKKLGISSLKIEGRMKSEEYVAAATRSAFAYKNNLENKYDTLETLKNVFSRSGFTDGYLAKKIDKNMFGVRMPEDIEKSKAIKNSIHEIYRRELSRVKIKFNLVVRNGKETELKVSDQDNNKIKLTGTIPQLAKTKPTSRESLISKLQKTGNTPYLVESVDVSIDDGLFVENSVISSLKQLALEKLTQLRGKQEEIPYNESEITFEKTEKKPHFRKFISVHKINQIPEKCDVDLIFVPLSTTIEDIKNLISRGYNIGIKTPVFFDKLNINKLSQVKEIGVNFALVQNVSAYNDLEKLGFTTICSPTLNVFNSYALEFSPYDYTTLSFELSEAQIKNIKSNKTKGILAYGKLPLMIFKNCPIKANSGCANCNNKITDRKDIEFTVFCEDGVTKMVNSVPLYIGDKQNLYNDMDYILLSFTDETPSDVTNVLESFEQQSPFGSSYTRGLYFKGVL